MQLIGLYRACRKTLAVIKEPPFREYVLTGPAVKGERQELQPRGEHRVAPEPAGPGLPWELPWKMLL